METKYCSALMDDKRSCDLAHANQNPECIDKKNDFTSCSRFIKDAISNKIRKSCPYMIDDESDEKLCSSKSNQDRYRDTNLLYKVPCKFNGHINPMDQYLKCETYKTQQQVDNANELAERMNAFVDPNNIMARKKAIFSS